MKDAMLPAARMCQRRRLNLRLRLLRYRLWRRAIVSFDSGYSQNK
jgi:hypothetical protein